MSANKLSKSHLLFLVLLAFTVRVIVAVLTTNQSGDADCRAYMSAIWATHPSVINSGIWLPLHFYLIGLLSFITGNALIAGKIISVVTGALTIIPLYSLTARSFGKQAALITGLIFCVFSLHVKLSAVCLSEAPFVLLALWAVDIVVREVRSENADRKAIFLSSMLLVCAGFIRQESWLLSLILASVLFTKKQTRPISAFYALLGLLSFVSWGMFNHFYGAGFMGGITGIIAYKQAASVGIYMSPLQTTAKWVNIFARSPGPFAMLFLFYGIWCSLKEKICRLPFLIAVSLLAPFYFMSLVSCGWQPQARYVILFSLLTLPYMSLGLCRMVGKRNILPISVVALLFLTVVWQAALNKKDSALAMPVPDRNREELGVSKFLKSAITRKDSLIIENHNWEGYGIIMRSGALNLNHAFAESGDEVEVLRKAAAKLRPTVLVSHSLKPETMNLSGTRARRVFVNDSYSVYKIDYHGVEARR